MGRAVGAAAAAGEDASQWKLSVEQGKAEAASMPCVLKAQAPEKEVKTRLTVTVTAPEGLRREADVSVDGRIAAMEAGLQKQLTQLQTIRARLATRSGLDADETTTLPKVTG